MIRCIVFCAALLTLAACGVDGEPEAPTVEAAASMGSSGYGALGMRVTQGPVSLLLAL